MRFRFLAVMLLACSISIVRAEPATQPTTAPADEAMVAVQVDETIQTAAQQQSPATQPAARKRQRNQTASAGPATQPAADSEVGETGKVASVPATQPTTQPLAKRFPTPAELIEKMKAQRAQEDARTMVAYFDLNDSIVEKPADFSFFGGESGTTLRSLLTRLTAAREDKNVRAVLVTLGANSGMNLAQAQELRDALVELRRAGKKTFVYADSYDTIGYTVASGATNVCLLEGGELMIPGIGIETMFYRGTLDKIGVLADYVQIGEYKGAEEPYTRTEPSQELRAELTKLIDSLYDQIVDGISLNRSLSTSAVREMIDETMISARVAKERGFVDHLVDQDGLRALLKDEMNNDVSILAEYGKPKREAVDFSNPFALLASLSKKPEPSNKPAIALIYAQGVIVDGRGEGGLFSEGGVGSEVMRETIRLATRDRNVKAIVVRIDSPGGSALASEVMWQALRRAAAEKPVIISIGSMAASGGYYLASAGDYIFADPAAIVGSIGVVGGKFVMKDLFDKIGLSSESFTKGRNAGLFSSNQAFDERQRRMIRTWMQQTYDQFTQRVMTTRSGKIKDIDEVARGRIFIAKQAKELGMIDELGGLDKAITYAADQANLKKDDYEVRMLPQPKTFADLLMGGGQEVQAPFKPTVTISPDSLLNVLSPQQRQMVLQHVQALRLLQDRPVMLMSPYTITVR